MNDLGAEDARILRQNEDTHLTYLKGSYLGKIISAAQNNKMHELAEELANERLSMENLRSKDPLTGAYTRQMLYEIVEKEMRWSGKRQGFGIVMVDIDHFKLINDTYGHNKGDEVLVELVKLMRETGGEMAEVARWGGEEFVVVVPGMKTTEELKAFAERIRMKVEQDLSGNTKLTNKVTVSMGLAWVEPGMSFEEEMKTADRNLYLAKNSGRNKVIAIEEVV